MMYQDKFVSSLKVGKDILREDKDTVLLPFGSEYSIYMKNLEGRTAVVSVELDGQDVLDGHELVLRPNQSTELEGFLKGSKVDARFKFIQKTAKIQEHRGDRIDDGFLRISFRFVKPPRPITYTLTYPYNARGLDDTTFSKGGPSASANEGFASMSYDSEDKMTRSCCSASGQSVSTPRPEEGITVRGSDSAQSFTTTSVGELETEVHVIVMKLMGVNPETAVPVEQPLTVKSKKECPTCGASNKSSMKFCGECGTRLD